jgi:hypothetical protein
MAISGGGARRTYDPPGDIVTVVFSKPKLKLVNFDIRYLVIIQVVLLNLNMRDAER